MSMTADKDLERVLCVAATGVKNACEGRHVSCAEAGLANSLRRLGPAFFSSRGWCETDETLKQLIPYVVLMCRSRFYCYTRGQSGGEDRLHARKSIGIGGHINPVDRPDGLSPEAAVLAAAVRELTEEVGVVGTDWTYLGLINDDSDAVGRVHLGVGLIFEMDDDEIEPREAAIAGGCWLTVEELWEQRDRLESWSRICVEYLRRES